MNILANYIGRTVLMSMLLVLLIFVALESVSSLVDGIGDLENNYNFFELLIYIALNIPQRVYESMPMACLIGCIMGLGTLANNSELTILRATGISVVKIVAYVLQPVILLILLAMSIGEYVMPYTEQLSDSRRMLLRSEVNIQTLDSGLWNKEGSEFMHFNAVYPNGVLYGVSRYHFDNQQNLQQASFSEKAVFQGDHWIESNGQVTTFLGDRTVSSTFDTRVWGSELTPELLQLIVLSPQSLGIKSLHRYSSYLDKHDRDSSRHKLSYWTKVLQPFTIAALVLMAISFVFGPLRQVTMGFRVFVGVVVGVVFNTFQEMLGPASLVFEFSPIIAVTAPAIMILLLGLILLRRAG